MNKRQQREKESQEQRDRRFEKLGMDHYFFIGGLPFLGLADNFFLKINVFQTIFFITFCNGNNFLTTILKKLQAFFIDLI